MLSRFELVVVVEILNPFELRGFTKEFVVRVVIRIAWTTVKVDAE